jgi:organic hydroperoxide reductase OsmC/OhrA
MHLMAHVVNRQSSQTVRLKTGEREHSLMIPSRPDGFGSVANGGELLLLALATCYCNDLYREAHKHGLAIDAIDVEVAGEYSGEGQPIRGISYRAAAWTSSPKDRDKVFELMTYTDSVGEIQRTLRRGTDIALTKCEVHES